jgi:hypothetical protein
LGRQQNFSMAGCRKDCKRKPGREHPCLIMWGRPPSAVRRQKGDFFVA